MVLLKAFILGFVILSKPILTADSPYGRPKGGTQLSRTLRPWDLGSSPNSPKIGDGLITALWGRNRLWGLTIIGAPLHPSTRIWQWPCNKPTICRQDCRSITILIAGYSFFFLAISHTIQIQSLITKWFADNRMINIIFEYTKFYLFEVKYKCTQ